MSDTPRVNTFLKEHGCGNSPIEYYGDDWSHYDIECFTDFARQLERELNQEQKDRQHNAEVAERAIDECLKLRAEVESLRKDKERLDWIARRLI